MIPSRYDSDSCYIHINIYPEIFSKYFVVFWCYRPHYFTKGSGFRFCEGYFTLELAWVISEMVLSHLIKSHGDRMTAVETEYV